MHIEGSHLFADCPFADICTDRDNGPDSGIQNLHIYGALNPSRKPDPQLCSGHAVASTVEPQNLPPTLQPSAKERP
ncbi:hypothetical protein [Rhizobium favelukesii]|uniref:hypothetical protein n=1 Tax=Rhizobium favelukesii TaxID=348824 RepID=UPI00041EB29C|nr:hypothetical protein [Rhizobium favelukesii]MCS0459223.1 hypothetical protein [Rhizobium favelukesii]